MPAPSPNYDPAFVARLFDEMSASYGTVNFISSFGFCRSWRRQCIDMFPPTRGAEVLDLMSGMGELCPDLARRIGPEGSLTTIDISRAMCDIAREGNVARILSRTDIRCEDALETVLPDASFDFAYSSFGLKTFDASQTRRLARQLHRVLRPGAGFAFLEISVPPSRVLRWPYMLYLNRVIPWIGRTLMGNWDNYRLLGVYTQAFNNCDTATDIFREAGLEATTRRFFFGCATGICGRRPLASCCS